MDSKLLFTEDGGKNWNILIQWSSLVDKDYDKKSSAFEISYGMGQLGDVFLF